MKNPNDLIVMTPYPVKPGQNLLTILRLAADCWRPEMKANAAHIAEGDNTGIVINKPASMMDYNKVAQNKTPSASLTFTVAMMNSESKKLTTEKRTLRFWLTIGDQQQQEQQHQQSIKQQASQLAQAYFCELIGSKPDDDFPKSYITFIIKLMRLLKQEQFRLVARMEVELRLLNEDDNHAKSTSRSGSLDTGHFMYGGSGGATVGQSAHRQQTGRKSPLTSQKVLDIIESSYPNPISVREICANTQSDEQQVRQLLEDLSVKEKIAPTGNDQLHYTRTTKATADTKIQLVKQMPNVIRAKQPVIAIITSQYCEKLAVDAMISDKETFVPYRTTQEMSSANYVYTLGNIGDHRVVSTKLTSVGHNRRSLIAAGNATTQLLGKFPDIEYVFLVGCGGGVPNYTDFASHVRLGDVVISHIPNTSSSDLISSTSSADKLKRNNDNATTQPSTTKQATKSGTLDDHVYVHCKAKTQTTGSNGADSAKSSITPSFSVHNNLKRLASLNNDASNNNNGEPMSSSSSSSSLSPTGGSSQIKDARWFERQQQKNNNNNQQSQAITSNQQTSQQQQSGREQLEEKPLEYDQCHFRLWRPTSLNLQELSNFLWAQGLEQQKHRIWEYYIDQGIKMLAQQDIDASRPKPDQDKLYMSLGDSGTIEVSHPEAADDELDLRRDGHPMCHFGPIGSGLPAAHNETLRQRMISEFGLRCFDMEFDPVVSSISGNCKESYIMIRGISDYQDGRKRKEWQQYAALVAAAFMKSIIVNLKPI